eukprot:gb/GECG01002704.1/.p1 GENE.gb/GECG01002704.1/~~gb/GECG01002704.1/.p1  ORF type:complete len:370 (+),score=70.39 gb/GECG01002704.1/:1-1110(+)
MDNSTAESKGGTPKKKQPASSSSHKKKKASNGNDNGSTPRQSKKKTTPKQKQAQSDPTSSPKGGGGKSKASASSTQAAQAPPAPSSSGKNGNKQRQTQETIHLDGEAAQNINYAVLRRLEPTLQEIITQASHVVIYVYQDEKGTWERKHVEGAAFIFKRQTEPQYRFLVTNRLNTTNFIQDITPSLTHQAQAPYLFFKDRSVGTTHGVWFYDEGEMQLALKTIKELPRSNDSEVQSPPNKAPVEESRASEEESRGTTNKAGANLLSLITGSAPGAGRSKASSGVADGEDTGEATCQPRRALKGAFEETGFNGGSPPQSSSATDGEAGGATAIGEEERMRFRRVFKEMLEDDSFMDMLIRKFDQVSQHTK